jgi:HK97 family phage major capsid protein
MLTALRAQRAAIKAELGALVKGAEGESRGLNADENTIFDTRMTEMKALDARIVELTEAEVRETAAAAHRATIAPVETRETATVSVGHEPNPVYRRGDATVSWFRDTLQAGRGDSEARNRLASSQETRAGDLTTVAGAGGQFAPPAWLIADYVAFARASRVTADLMSQHTLQGGVSSINLPKVSTGATTGVQATQNSALTDTAMTTTSVSSGITMIAGKQIISRQLLDQSGIPFDEVILKDLAADYAQQIDKQVLYGTGANGQLRGLSGAGTTITYTTSTPKVIDGTTAANSFYNVVIKAANSVASNRFLPATAVIMRPDRWGWILEALDGNGRPLVTPSTAVFNQLAEAGAPVAQGAVGNLLGLPVFLDPNIPVTLNSATNQDGTFVIRQDDCWLYETALESASFEATYADNASVLFRVLGYSAFIPDRYAASVSVILGTGCVQVSL